MGRRGLGFRRFSVSVDLGGIGGLGGVGARDLGSEFMELGLGFRIWRTRSLSKTLALNVGAPQYTGPCQQLSVLLIHKIG